MQVTAEMRRRAAQQRKEEREEKAASNRKEREEIFEVGKGCRGLKALSSSRTSRTVTEWRAFAREGDRSLSEKAQGLGEKGAGLLW